MNVVTIVSLAAIAFVLTLLIANILQHRHLFRDHFQRKTKNEAATVEEKLFEGRPEDGQK